MNRKLSDEIVLELTFLSLAELQNILIHFNNPFKGDRYDTLKQIAKYDDADVLPLLPTPSPLVPKDKRPISEKLAEIRSYYKTEVSGIEVDNIVRKRGRKKSTGDTLKDKVFAILDINNELSYEEVLKAGIINIAGNTFKTILSQYRKEKGIKVKRGRKSKE